MTSKSFPTKLAELDTVAPDNVPVHFKFVSDYISLANLAGELDFKLLLSHALYWCARFKPAYVVDGAGGPDGRIEKLSSDNVLRVMMGRHRLTVTHVKNLNALGLAEGWVCPRPVPGVLCHLGRRRIVNSMMDEALSVETLTVHPLRWASWDTLFKPPQGGRSDVCGHCQKQMMAKYNEGREAILTSLPGYFKLPAEQD